MKQMRMLLFAVSALLAPAGLQAGQTFAICNYTQFEVSFAAAENNGFLSGGSWDVRGWYKIPPGKCIDDSSWGWGGRRTHVGFAFRDSGGTWGSPVFDIPSGSNVSRSDESFCVADDAFEYSLPGDLTSNLLGKSNLPHQPCKAGQYFYPASIYNPAPSEGCDAHGFYCAGFAHFDLKLKTDRAIPVGPQAQASGGRPVTRTLILGGEVHFDGQWRYTNGTVLPADLIDQNSGRPPLHPKEQYSTNKAPVQGYIKEIEGVMSSLHTCAQGGFTTMTTRRVNASNLVFDDTGVVGSITVRPSGDPARLPDMEVGGAALADLYLSSAKLWKLDGCTWVTITCKDARKCAQWRPGNAQPLIEFYVNTPEEAQQVLNLLKELAPFYPEGAAH